MLYIGIDAGVNTGVAVWDDKQRKLLSVESMQLHQALEKVQALHLAGKICVIIEDARLRTWYGNDWKQSKQKLQGVGSVKRDCVIWEEFCTDKKIEYYMQHPKHNVTKLTAEAFQIITGYKGRTNEHGRDAAMLVFGR